MSNFWEVSTGETVENNGTFDGGGGSFEPLPDGTTIHGLCDNAEWNEYDGVKSISLSWEVLEGEFKGRKIFQKVRVNELDSKKRDRAIKMLGAIDSNAGGELRKLAKEPSDMDLSTALVNKSMLLKLGVWDLNGKKGNWVMAVSPSGSASPVPAKTATAAVSKDGDIPF